MINVPDKICYRDCNTPGQLVPTASPAETAWHLLENVADARCGALLTIENTLATGSMIPEVRSYWYFVRTYQTTPHVLPEALNSGGDPNATRLDFEILYAGSGAPNGNAYSVDVEMYGTHRSEWLTVVGRRPMWRRRTFAGPRCSGCASPRRESNPTMVWWT